MDSIKDILKKVNKDISADADKLKIASTVSDDYFQTGSISTGCPYLDYRTGGGFVEGGFNLIVGKEGAGKSSLALIAAANVQKKGQYVVYFDGEDSVSESYLQRFGVQKDLLIHRKERNLEKTLDLAEAFSAAEEVGLIVFDSIPIFTASAVEDSSADKHHIGREAKKWTERFSIIEGNCIRRKTTIIGLTFYTTDPGAHPNTDNRVIKRGKWQKLASKLTLEISKRANSLIKDDNSLSPIGHNLTVKILKSKRVSYDPKEIIETPFYYEYGFNEIDGYVRVCVEKGLINKSGSWFTFPNVDGEEEKVQGITGLVQHFKENPKDYENLVDLSKNI